MKPEELQIGDWVCWKGKPVQIAQISGIKYSFGHIDVELAHCGSGFLERHDIKSISPIPITSEILLKNGFEKVENSGGFSLYRKDENGFAMYHIHYHHHYYLDIDGYIRGISTFEGVNIQYIHQLQQALRLCGITIEIKI